MFKYNFFLLLFQTDYYLILSDIFTTRLVFHTDGGMEINSSDVFDQ